MTNFDGIDIFIIAWAIFMLVGLTFIAGFAVGTNFILKEDIKNSKNKKNGK